MIGAAIGAGVSLVSGIMGASKASKAAKAQQQLINDQRTKNEAWYNRNYYQNYLDSSEARSAMKRVEDTMRRRNQEAQATAAVTGGTQEAVLAQQGNDQKMMSEVVGNLASRGDEIKRQVDAQNQANENALMQQQMAQYQANEAGGTQLLGNSGSLLGSALSLFDKKGV